jgi:hypothetical protein
VKKTKGEPFLSPIRPDLRKGRADRQYVILKEQNELGHFVLRVIDKGRKGNANTEVSHVTYAFHPDGVYLYDAWTHDKYRKLNLMSTVLDAACRDALSAGKEKADLLSKKEALGFHANTGFEKTGMKHGLTVMEKKLSKNEKQPAVKTFAERKSASKRRRR